MKPTIGRIVHYVSYGTPVREDGSQEYPSVCRAAIITDVGREPRESRAALAVLNPTGLFLSPQLLWWAAARDREPGTWHSPLECEELHGGQS